MWAYLTVYSAFSLLGFSLNDRQARIVVFFALAFLLWFMGTRYEVGCDFGGYLNRFYLAPETVDFEDISKSGEPGFELLIRSVKAFDLDYMWLNVFASAIILLGFSRFLATFRLPLLILALLFPILILQLSMSGIRQAIAVALLMASANPFLKGHRISTALWILAATAFHTSAVIFLPIALVAGRKVSFLRLVGAAAVLLPAAIFIGGDRFDTYQDRYIDQIYGEVSSGGAFIRYAMILLPAVFFLVFRKRFAAEVPREYDFLNLFSIIIVAVGLAGLVSSLALHRLNYYIMPFSLVIFAYASVVFGGRNKSNRRLLKIVPILMYGGYMVFWLGNSRHADICYKPYQSYTLSDEARGIELWHE